MTYLIRPANGGEREMAGRAWRSLLSLPMRGVERDEDAGQLLVGLPRVSVGRGWLRRALELAVAEALESCSVLVADHPDAPNLALGFVAFDPDPLVIHALVVEARYRKAWVGRELLQHVLMRNGYGVARCTVMTDAGRRLLGHVREGMSSERRRRELAILLEAGPVGSSAWNSGGNFAQNERALPDGRVEVAP